MKITLLVVAAAALAGCAGAEEMAAQGPDGGAMAQTGTGGTGGSSEPAAGGTGGSSATGGSGGTMTTGDAGAMGGSGGTGGTMAAPDAGGSKMDAMVSTDSKPATGEPMACVSTYHIVTGVCMDPPNSKDGKVLYKDGRACNFCATYKADGRTIDKQFVGCVPGAGSICVMNCSECK